MVDTIYACGPRSTLLGELRGRSLPAFLIDALVAALRRPGEGTCSGNAEDAEGAEAFTWIAIIREDDSVVVLAVRRTIRT